MRNGFSLTKKALLLFLIPLLLIIISFFVPYLHLIAIGFNIILIITIILDLFLSPDYKNKVSISFKFDNYLKLDQYSKFKVIVENSNKLPVQFYVLMDLDTSFDRNYSRQKIKIKPLEKAAITLKIFPERRGLFKSKLYFIKAKSIFRLVNIYRKYQHDLTINVVPTTFVQGDSFRFLQEKIKKFEGYQKNRRIGEGSDFEMLRDYIKGDEFGHIDWKATARRRKPVSRLYRLENNFELSLMIDCGRLMATEVKGVSLLDYAVNAAVVLSYAAVKGNDSVSLTAFGSQIIKYIPPSKNLKTIKRLNYALSDLQYQFAESDYQTAFGFIRSKLNKRSLIVLFTDIIDDSNLKIYHKYFSLIKKKHIVLLVLLRDKNLFQTADSIPGTKTSIYTKAAAVDLVLRRNKAIFDLKRLGIEVLDLFPEQVNADTLNKYLNIKHKN